MVKDIIDRDPKYVFHLPNGQSILLWLFQSQDDPKIQKITQKSKSIFKKTPNTKGSNTLQGAVAVIFGPRYAVVRNCCQEPNKSHLVAFFTICQQAATRHHRIWLASVYHFYRPQAYVGAYPNPICQTNTWRIP